MGGILFAIIGFQLAILSVLSFGTWVLGGQVAFYSMLLGGLCYVLPTFISVLVLNFLKRRPVIAGAGFLFAEGLKTVLALFLMIGVFVWYAEIRFIPFFIGLVGVSHFAFLLFLRVYHYGR